MEEQEGGRERKRKEGEGRDEQAGGREGISREEGRTQKCPVLGGKNEDRAVLEPPAGSLPGTAQFHPKRPHLFHPHYLPGTDEVGGERRVTCGRGWG